MLACVWMDVVFLPLLALGVETVVPFGGGDGKSYGGLIIHANWTHSLLGALVLAATFSLVCSIPWGRKLGAVMGAVVFSHWMLDLAVHHHDMPVLPVDHVTLLGFGLWSHPALAALLELVLFLGGTWLYWRSAVRTTHAAGESSKRANIAALAMTLSGFVTLALNVAGG